MAETLDMIRKDLGTCQRCKLHVGRKHIVFGAGNPRAKLVLVGEAPGYEEDIQGQPFVGQAGQLLTRILQAIGLTRDDVYMCNIIKCRPPGNRNPEPDEIAACIPFLSSLDILPMFQQLLGIGEGSITENMRVAPNHKIYAPAPQAKEPEAIFGAARRLLENLSG